MGQRSRGTWGHGDMGTWVCFLDLALLRAIEDATRGVGATAFPRQLMLLKKTIAIGMRGPHKPMQPTDRAPARKIIKNIPLESKGSREKGTRGEGDKGTVLSFKLNRTYVSFLIYSVFETSVMR